MLWWEGAYDMAVFGICQFFGRYFGNLNKNGRYSVFQSPDGDGEIKFQIKNTTWTVFIQKCDYDTTVIFEKNNGIMVILNLVRPPPNPKRMLHMLTNLFLAYTAYNFDFLISADRLGLSSTHLTHTNTYRPKEVWRNSQLD